MSGVAAKIGAALRDLRSRSGISQEGLALLAGLDRTYISGIERGTRNPTVASLERVCDALGCRISELLQVAELLAGMSIADTPRTFEAKR